MMHSYCKTMTEAQENMLDHYKNPFHFGKPNTGDFKYANSKNLSCGDEITMFLDIKNNCIKDVRFEGVGCSICIGTASQLAEAIINKTIDEVKNIDKEFILDLIGMDLSISRIKCALISLDAVGKIVESNP